MHFRSPKLVVSLALRVTIQSSVINCLCQLFLSYKMTARPTYTFPNELSFHVWPGREGHHHHHHHLSLNREGRWGTTDDFATSFLHFSVFSTTLWDLANSRPVHPLMLSSHLFFCLPCLLSPFTVPCKMVLARSSCGPNACWILARTCSLVTWSLYEMCSRCIDVQNKP